jgi:hypothetical protein
METSANLADVVALFQCEESMNCQTCGNGLDEDYGTFSTRSSTSYLGDEMEEVLIYTTEIDCQRCGFTTYIEDENNIDTALLNIISEEDNINEQQEPKVRIRYSR